MVSIRLSRGGTKKRPFYQIVVADGRLKRDGRYIERIGFFNPIATGGEVRLRLDRARAEYWIDRGAKPSDRVGRLLQEPVPELGNGDTGNAEIGNENPATPMPASTAEPAAAAGPAVS